MAQPQTKKRTERVHHQKKVKMLKRRNRGANKKIGRLKKIQRKMMMMMRNNSQLETVKAKRSVLASHSASRRSRKASA